MSGILTGFLLTSLILAAVQTERFTTPPAHQYAGQGRVERLQKLLEADPQALLVRDQAGRMPLHAAAAGGHTKTVALLLARSAPPDVADGEGWTPLHHAAAGGHLQVVDLLLKAGANPAVRERSGYTAADLAERGGHRAVKQRLGR